MPSTKIINVLKDDKFEEVLDIFKNTPAKEIIFVLPKTNNALKDEEHFIILNNEAKKAAKAVSLLCSNSEINELGKKYDFDILMPKPSTNATSKRLNKPITLINQMEPKDQKDDEEEIGVENETRQTEPDKNEDDNVEEEDKKTEPENEELNDFDLLPAESIANYTEDDLEIVTASAPFKTNRNLNEIITAENEEKINIRILQKKEREKNIDINKNQSEEKTNQIKSVWQFSDNHSGSYGRNDDSLWKRINFPGKRLLKIKKFFGGYRSRYTIMVSSGIAILLFAAIFLISGSAKIDIKPKKQEINLSLKISVSDKYSSVDATFNKIPGQLFNIEKIASQTFLTTGQREVIQKAKGTITVYNEYGTTPQTLIATTRFESPEGFIFRTLKTIIVPGTKVENGKIIPGSINVEIIADKPGPLYNIAPSKFMIPAFKEKGDSDRYGKFYGQSYEPMKNGISGWAKIVTESDYNAAKETLTATVKTAIAEALKTQTSGLKIINPEAVAVKIPDTSAKIDEATDNFIMTVSGSIKTFGFKQEDLHKLIKQYSEKDNADIVVLPEKLDIGFDQITMADNSTLTFTAKIKGNGYAKINTQNILSDLLGNNKPQIQNYFKNAEKIMSAKVLLLPFWVKKMPKNKDKIQLNLIYD